MKDNVFNTSQARFIERSRCNLSVFRRNEEHPVIKVEIFPFDMSAYVNYVRGLLDGNYDYILIEPYFSFEPEIF